MTDKMREAVGIVDESDEGLFVEVLYGDDGSILRRGDKLYLSPPDRGYVSRLAYEATASELAKARALLSRINARQKIDYADLAHIEEFLGD